jgi:nicotinamidase-related amidase
MLSRKSAVLVVIDIQGNLFEAMQGKEELLANALKVVKGAKIFNLPIIITEQIPQKLGQTLPLLAQELADCATISKESFSCWGNSHFKEKIELSGRKEVIILGIECHVCVYQTAIDLINHGYDVHVVADAVSSRTKENSDIGIEVMKNSGAYITSTEMVLFELLHSADDAKFKEIYKLVK